MKRADRRVGRRNRCPVTSSPMHISRRRRAPSRPTARLAPARPPVDWAVWGEAGCEPRLHVGQRARAAPRADAGDVCFGITRSLPRGKRALRRHPVGVDLGKSI